MKIDAQNILILAPHTDDGELGCGGAIAKYIAAGKTVTYMAFSTCSQALPRELPENTLMEECRSATQRLGISNVLFLDFEVRQLLFHRQEILEELISVNKDLKPDTVFLPGRNDIHQDHQVVFAEGLRAFRNSNLLGYELPWNNLNFQPTYFETLAEEYLSLKQKALLEYRSQTHRKYMNPDFIRSLAVVRGLQCGASLAESFEVYRLLGD